MVETDQFKKNDLYIYELSADVLGSLSLIYFDSNLREMPSVPIADELPIEKATQTKKPALTALECNVCKAQFDDLEQSREHRRTELHTYNVKRNIRNLPPVDVDTFQALISNQKPLTRAADPLSSDTDGGQSDREDDESEPEEIYSQQSSFLDGLLEEEIANMSVNDDNNDGSASYLNTRSPLLYFNSQLLTDSEAFGAYKALFTGENEIKPLQALKGWNQMQDQSSTISALFMVGGGHFAGAIVSHQRANVNGNARKQNQSSQEQAVILLEHKTFHRYTTRRKQGGSQSAMDQAKGKANSAGSDLRRYNEAALKMDIKNLLAEWEPFLKNCENIFLRATNIHERKLFTENKEIKKVEQRLKTFPFTTGRPTVAELKRSWCELTYLKKLPKPEPILVKETSPISKSPNKPQNEPKEPSFVLSPEESHTKELLQLLKRAKAPLLLAYLRKNDLDANFRLKPDSQYSTTPTMLHFASQQGLRQMITILISNMKCDPCIKNDFGKTAWDLAKSDEVKYAFQLARHNLGEGHTNWDDTHIGKPLSREDIDALNKEKAELEKKATEEVVKRELENVKEKQRAEIEQRRGPGRTLANNVPVVSQNLNSLNDDQRRRLMREQRARAAEARMCKR